MVMSAPIWTTRPARSPHRVGRSWPHRNPHGDVLGRYRLAAERPPMGRPEGRWQGGTHPRDHDKNHDRDRLLLGRRRIVTGALDEVVRSHWSIESVPQGHTERSSP